MIKKNIKSYDYYDLKITTKLKKWAKRQYRLFNKLKYLYLIFALIIGFITCISQMKIYTLNHTIMMQDKIINLERYKNKELQSLLKKEIVKQAVEIKIIHEKVENLHNFISRYYPNYSYKNKVNEVLYNNKNADDLPEDLWNIYVQKKFIEPHGLNKYEKALPNTIFPIAKESGYVPVKGGEFASSRPYNKRYGYKHLGFDCKSLSNNSVFAVYDMIIWKKYYTEMSGNIIEAKFKYENEEGEFEWYFIRMMHLSDVNMFVKKGENIKKGTVIATMDSTGYLSTGSHVHIELWKLIDDKWRPINFVKNSTWNNKIERVL